ncbi:MAG: aminodeoxychorismate synthase component I [Vicinamibacteria bacterium]|nr:aminodeoxychorismate synthase component I [Vicinamibacteria bacterium]
MNKVHAPDAPLRAGRCAVDGGIGDILSSRWMRVSERSASGLDPATSMLLSSERPEPEYDYRRLDRPGTVWIDRWRAGRPADRALLFASPISILIAWRPEEVEPTLMRLESSLKQGFHAAGYIAYEAGLIHSGILTPRHALTLPLIWIGVYRSPGFVSTAAPESLIADSKAIAPTALALETGEPAFLDAVARISERLTAGDVYQVNLTGKLAFDNPKGAADLFHRIRLTHPVPYSAFINAGDFQIVSLSPELFLRRRRDHIVTRPMKGTARRGRWSGEDRDLVRRLTMDEKCRAENLMIVDLMRNDFGRVCRLGSVQARRLFTVERYRSVLQMTSTVTGLLRPDMTLVEIMRATLPAGSVTGAPKIRACEIIDSLENDARGVYCGHVGWFEPGGDFTLNVAIRTVVQRGHRCVLGVGSGIVADSDARAELAETRLKGVFIGSAPADFHLLETLLWRERAGYAFLAEHLRRMLLSARYFGWRFREKELRKTLANAVSRARSDTAHPPARVRLLLDRYGHCEAHVSSLDDPADAIDSAHLWLSPHRTDPSDVLLFHKTTRRSRYDADRREALDRGCIDALYANTRDEITECAVMSVIVLIEGIWLAPPLAGGLLPGIWRAAQLRRGDVTIRPINVSDLSRAQRIRIGNSVRGSIEIERVTGDDGRILFQKRASPLK